MSIHLLKIDFGEKTEDISIQHVPVLISIEIMHMNGNIFTIA